MHDELAAMADESVDCVVTSPPYWGLRDYGTGSWDGGDSDCVHRVGGQVQDTKAKGAITAGVRPGVDASACLDCGATRVDRQLGLEATPGEYVENMVAVFREVRRVLAPHGTVWLNLGDSYSHGGNGSRDPIKWPKQSRNDHRVEHAKAGGDTKPKDLVGIPWRVAFALQAGGWYLRSDIVWSKPNPMPESVTDRPTKSHEYVFLLSKQPRYWFDAEAVREASRKPYEPTPIEERADWGKPNRGLDLNGNAFKGVNLGDGTGRNVRSVWEIATQPYAGAHFATFPQELVRRCLLAGCPVRVCRTCGKPSDRMLEKRATGRVRERSTGGLGTEIRRETHGLAPVGGTFQEGVAYETVGWTDCGHDDWRPGVVLDPFMGSGTTALVARQHGRHAVGIELNEEYAALCATRLQQLSLLAEGAA